MLKGLHHAAIICADYPKSKYFYQHILQLKVISEHYRAERDSYKLDLALPDGSQIELFSFNNPPQRVSYPEACGLRHLAFRVESIENMVTYLTEQGVMVEPIRIDEYTQKAYTFFSDPDGLPLEIYQE
ncbi:VOC family protein [Thalassotalea piscium]